MGLERDKGDYSRYVWRSTITIPEFYDKINEVKAF
jgi:hypothetical protein